MVDVNFIMSLSHHSSHLGDLVLSARVPLDWISTSSRLRAVRLDGPVIVTVSLLNRSCLFVVSVYALTDCNLPENKDRFHPDSCLLPRSVPPADVVIVGGNMIGLNWRNKIHENSVRNNVPSVTTLLFEVASLARVQPSATCRVTRSSNVGSRCLLAVVY